MAMNRVKTSFNMSEANVRRSSMEKLTISQIVHLEGPKTII